MNPQIKLALQQIALAMAIAALAALGQHYTELPVDPGYAWVLVIIGALIPALIRVLEGWQDGVRASHNDIRRSDVGYREIIAMRTAKNRA